MREVGTIKWFGGLDRVHDRQLDYGFIGREGQDDLYVHQRQVRCDLALLTPGALVTFDAAVGRSGKREAFDLILLDQEDDQDVLAQAIRSADQSIWQAALGAFRRRGDLCQGVRLLKDCLPQRAPRTWQRLLAELPDSVLREERGWRAALAPADQARILCGWLQEEPQILQQPALRVEITALARIVDASTQQRLVELIPRSVAATSQALRAVLPIQEHVALVLELLGRLTGEEDDRREALILELAPRAEELTPELWDQLPALLTIQDELWAVAQSGIQRRNLLRAMSVCQAQEYPLVLARLRQVLEITPLEERATLIAPLRAAAIHDHAIVSRLGALDRARAIVELLHDPQPPAWAFEDVSRVLSTISVGIQQQLALVLPLTILAQKPELRSLLPAEHQLRVCCELLDRSEQEPEAGADREALIAELAHVLRGMADATVASVPLRLLALEPLRASLRPKALIHAVAVNLQSEEHVGEPEMLTLVRTALERTPSHERVTLLRPIAGWASLHIDLVATLPLEGMPPLDQVHWTWPHLCQGRQALWAQIQPPARILAIYRAAQEEVRLPFIEHVDDEPDRLARAALLLLRARFGPEWRGDTFTQSHDLIQEEIVERAWDVMRPLNLYPLLPLCRPGLSVVAYCEGRPWMEGVAYCPRRSGACIKHRADVPSAEADCYGTRNRLKELHPQDENLGLLKLYRRNYYGVERLQPELTRNDLRCAPEAGWKLAGFDEQAGTLRHVRWTPLKRGGRPAATLAQEGIPLAQAQEDVFYQMRGAHIQPLRTLSWQNWSLHELLASARVTPDLRDLRAPEEYVSLLTGWVNRLIDIRERLKCRHCGGVMRPHYGYARHLAAYRVTIISCPAEGSEHDKDVYLNHCWACSSIIDSRDSRHQAGGLYICEACGSAPRPPREDDKVDIDATARAQRLAELRQMSAAGVGHRAELTADTFAQGDICPRCGAEGMLFRHASIYRKCWRCDHQLDIPAAEKRTGPHCRYCRDGRATLVHQDDGSTPRICVNCRRTQPEPRGAPREAPRAPAKGGMPKAPARGITPKTRLYDPDGEPPIESYEEQR